MGSYLVECKPLVGFNPPPLFNVTVNSGQIANPSLVYLTASGTTGSQPQALDFATVSNGASGPYAWVGQIRSSAGAGTGFAVKDRVVATAAHVVFDEGSLTAVRGLQWLHQHDVYLFEPVPTVPRGYYLIDGYASQRSTETPGSYSLASRHLDVAALYFVNNQDAARTGFSGYLATDLDNNEFLLSNAQKMLVGYPLDGVPAVDQGRMHATSAATLVFASLAPRVFSTSDIGSSGGNSGGPLCVQHTDGTWYPAAVYLGGATQSIVRAIDSVVIQLFNSAQQSGIDDQGYTGGGITHSGYTTGGTASTGALRIDITPSAAGWRPVGSIKSFTPSGNTRSSLTPGTFDIEFTPVSGFVTPANESVQVIAGTTQLYSIQFASSQTPLDTWRQVFFGTTSNTGSAADSADPDGDGFTNAQEYAAGTNPNTTGDFFKASNPSKAGSSFSVGTAGKAGRTYVLERSGNLSTWTTIATQGPLASDGAVNLTDPASTSDAFFYRIRVTGP